MLTRALEAVARNSVAVAHITGEKAVAASEAAGVRAAEALAYVLKEPAQQVAHAANSLAGAAERFRRVVFWRARERDAQHRCVFADALACHARGPARTHARAVPISYTGILGQAGAQ
jgi:hypothetical protein